MRPLKVGYVLKRFPRLSQTFVLHELLELRRQGVEPVIIAQKGAESEPVQPQYAELDAPVYYLPASAEPTPQAALIAPLVRQLGLVHLHAHFATWAAGTASALSAITGLPYSFTAHAHDIFHASVDRPALAKTIAAARFVVTVSDYNRAYLRALLAEHGQAGTIVRLYNSIDFTRFGPAAGPREPDLVVGVGRLIEKKGFADLIDACRMLAAQGRPVRCLIVGEGPARAALERQIAQAGLHEHVRLLGALPQPVVLCLVARAAVFALPCVVGADGDRDGLPTVLLEAIALGTPVISTAIVGIPELIAHEHSGLLVSEHDPRSLACAIARLLDAPALQRQLAHAALVRARADFNLATNVRRLIGMFQGEGLPW